MLDSWAVLAWLQQEEAGREVRYLLADAARHSHPANLSSINAGEVYYNIARRQGQEMADAFWNDAVSGQLHIRLFAATDPRVRRAAAIKATHPVAYADAFAIALARELTCPLVTGDREIRSVADGLGIELHWLG